VRRTRSFEFIAEKTLEDTHVGGYDNTMFDLVFNLIGGVIAVLVLSVKQTSIQESGGGR